MDSASVEKQAVAGHERAPERKARIRRAVAIVTLLLVVAAAVFLFLDAFWNAHLHGIGAVS